LPEPQKARRGQPGHDFAEGYDAVHKLLLSARENFIGAPTRASR
jgi:hypothetical protein